MLKARLHRLATISLAFTFIVMLAGSIVRMTGSGMGCPDWPKCFGYYIPPTDLSTLTWRANRSFSAGQVIIRDEALLVADRDFTTGLEFDAANWRPYTKHDYALFNPVHTWIEFVNRLMGALMGIPVFLLFIFSVAYFRKDPIVTILAGLALLLLGFEAWLGKLVVDGNLVPHQITMHMFGALGLIAIFTLLLVRLRPNAFAFKPRRDNRLHLVGVIGIVLLLVQIYLGTTVREMVDLNGKSHLISQDNWIDKLGVAFIIHRSLSLVVLVLLAYFGIRLVRTRIISTWPRILLACLLLEIVIGFVLATFDLPALAQPLHLIFAAFIFALSLGLLLQYQSKTVAMNN